MIKMMLTEILKKQYKLATEKFAIKLLVRERPNMNMRHFVNAVNLLDLNTLVHKIENYDASARAIADRVETGIVVF